MQTNLREVLAAPVAGRIFFAGEATNPIVDVTVPVSGVTCRARGYSLLFGCLPFDDRHAGSWPPLNPKPI